MSEGKNRGVLMVSVPEFSEDDVVKFKAAWNESMKSGAHPHMALMPVDDAARIDVVGVPDNGNHILMLKGNLWMQGQIDFVDLLYGRNDESGIVKAVPVPEDGDIEVLSLPEKDKFFVLLLKGDCWDYGQMDAIHVLLRDRGLNAVIVAAPFDDSMDVMDANQTLSLLKPAVAALSDEELESIGLKRIPKPDISDITRSFSA